MWGSRGTGLAIGKVLYLGYNEVQGGIVYETSNFVKHNIRSDCVLPINAHTWLVFASRRLVNNQRNNRRSDSRWLFLWLWSAQTAREIRQERDFI
jgi:hypothetical protein